MRFCAVLFFSVCVVAAGVPATARAGDEAAEAQLKDIVERQKFIFAKAEAAGPTLDEDELRSQLQQLCNEYDAILRRNPSFVPALVSYALLLGKVDMRKESVGLLLKANQLDKNLPLVKNQLGNYLAEEGKPVDAMRYYLAAIDLEPQEPLYHYQLGTLLAEARDDFLKAGQWTRAELDKTMQEAFSQAVKTAPGDWRYGYRYGLSFYDVEQPNWENALQFWKDFEKTMNKGVEQQTCRLHQAKVLIALGRSDDARTTLDTVTEPSLGAQKEKLLSELHAPALQK
jgi:tetratricopeptide (TPR) repeat protein